MRGVHGEVVYRGYHFTAAKISRSRAPSHLTVARGQLEFEWHHLMQKLKKLLGIASLSFFAQLSVAASFVNTSGSEDGVAISGFDTVAFITEKKSMRGRAEYSVEWMGAKWLFSSQANMALFKTNPEKYAPQYGGHCPWCVSENCICGRPVNGVFEVYNGKLYLFPDGNYGKPNGVKNAWWRKGGGPNRRIPNGDRNWPALKAILEARPDSSAVPAQVPNPAINMDAAR